MCLHENHKEGFQTEKRRNAILIMSLKIEHEDLFKLY